VSTIGFHHGLLCEVTLRNSNIHNSPALRWLLNCAGNDAGRSLSSVNSRRQIIFGVDTMLFYGLREPFSVRRTSVTLETIYIYGKSGVKYRTIVNCCSELARYGRRRAGSSDWHGTLSIIIFRSHGKGTRGMNRRVHKCNYVCSLLSPRAPERDKRLVRAFS
jgi:hypothetical protein